MSALTDLAYRVHAITTIILESAATIMKTLKVDHAAGWLPGQLYIGLVGGAGTEDTKVPVMVLVEKDIAGQTVHDAYLENEALIVWHAQPGDRIALRLAAGLSIEEGEYIVSAGSGDVRAYNSGPDSEAAVFAMALEDLTLDEGDINLLAAVVI